MAGLVAGVGGGARRLRPPSWRDPRLVVGVLLVLVCVALTVRLVAAADRTVPVYVARVSLPVGTAVSVDQLAVARLRLTGTSAVYLAADAPLPGGLVTQRTVGAGELVPLAALVAADRLTVRPVGVPLASGVPAGLVPGGRVDVWTVPTGGSGPVVPSTGSGVGSGTAGSGVTEARQGARRIISSAAVSDVTGADPQGLSVRGASVQLLVPQGELAGLLEALAGDGDVVVLPVPGGRG